jgi:V8-like Glu-specific endopeptidase
MYRLMFAVALMALLGLQAPARASLSPVPAQAGYPWRAIVQLQATFPNHKTFDSTGVMVDPTHVLTAGHVLYHHEDGGYASQIIATPDLYATSQPFGTARMVTERTEPAFIQFETQHLGRTAPGDEDIGLVTLDRPIGQRTAWLNYGFDNNNADFVKGTVYYTAGYPATHGYDGRHMHYSFGAVAGLSTDGTALEYYQPSITTYGGQSGSPVWRYVGGVPVVYGVHVGGDETPNSLNFATRITERIAGDLTAWRVSDGTATPPARPTTPAGPPEVRAVFNGKLYGAFQADGTHAFSVHTTADGVTWTPAVTYPGIRVGGTPALAVFNGRLYAAFQADDPSHTFYVTSTSDGTNWVTPATGYPGIRDGGAPALAVINGKLYAAFQADDSSRILYATSTADGVHWMTPAVGAPGTRLGGAPALVIYNGRLYV